MDGSNFYLTAVLTLLSPSTEHALGDARAHGIITRGVGHDGNRYLQQHIRARSAEAGGSPALTQV